MISPERLGRSQEFIGLTLSSVVWKTLVGQEVHREDLDSVDVLLTRSMQDIRNIHQKGKRAICFFAYEHVRNASIDCFPMVGVDSSALQNCRHVSGNNEKKNGVVKGLQNHAHNFITRLQRSTRPNSIRTFGITWYSWLCFSLSTTTT